MKTYLRLLRLQINQRFGLSALRAEWKERKGRTLGKAALGLIAVFGIASLLGLYTWLIAITMPAFLQLQMGEILLGVILLVSMVFVFFMGLVYLIGVLYFAKDSDFLAALPIPQKTVFAAKFSQVLFGEMVVGFLFLLPPFIVYGIQSAASFAYWVRALIVVVFAPCIPLALSALLSMLLMRFSVLWKRRDLFTIIGSVILVVGIIAGQGVLTSALPDEMTADAMLALISNSSALLRTVVSVFPPSGWAAQGLTGSAAMLTLFVAVSGAALLFVTLLAGRIYYKGASAQTETAAKNKVVLSEKTKKRHSTLFALFLREWRTVIRSPVYALNGLLTIIMGPLLLILPKIYQGASSGSGEMDMVMDILNTAVDQRIILLILAALYMVMGMISPALTTSVSREGKSFSFLRTIPVSPARQIVAKYVFGLSISLLTMVFMGVSATLMMGFSLAITGSALLLGMVASLAPLALSMLPDVLRPKLIWNNETEAIKQNFNSILGMLIGWGYVALLVFAGYQGIKHSMDAAMVIAIAAGISILLGGACIWILTRAAKRSWRTIEG